MTNVYKKNYPEVREIPNEYLIEEYKSLFHISKAKKLPGYRPQYRRREVVV